MNVCEQITHRTSLREFDPMRPVDPGSLDRILEAGRLAPSACNRQPWEFILVKSPEALGKVRACYAKPWFSQAPMILAVAGFKSKAWTRRDGYCSLETDLTIAMDHLILAADQEGVGTCWIADFQNDTLRKALDLGEDQEIFAITPLGYPPSGHARKNPKTRKSLGEILRIL